uniref:Protein containing OSTMP1 domain n=1 Tax=Rhipicephalus zambeziensis TaxID=60191 RepID=A0A224YS28_9ACAR
MKPSTRTACFMVFLATLLFVERTLATEFQFHTPQLSEPVSTPSVHPDDGRDDRPWENCTNLLETIAEATSMFELCALMNAKPFTMCMNCAEMYGSGIGIFYQLTTNTTDPASRLCRHQFFSSTKVSIVDKTFTHIQDLWTSASCDGEAGNSTIFVCALC